MNCWEERTHCPSRIGAVLRCLSGRGYQRMTNSLRRLAAALRMGAVAACMIGVGVSGIPAHAAGGEAAKKVQSGKPQAGKPAKSQAASKSAPKAAAKSVSSKPAVKKAKKTSAKPATKKPAKAATSAKAPSRKAIAAKPAVKKSAAAGATPAKKVAVASTPVKAPGAATAGRGLAAASPFGLKAPEAALVDSLWGLAPRLDKRVLGKAVAAMQCATSSGLPAAQRLAVIDFSLPSSVPRLWIFDLEQRKLVMEELVAHGQKSGDDLATRFSNRVGSHQSSIGLFRTGESYFGEHGYALRMDGLEPGVNDKARERAIVVHAADYVDPSWIARQGRIGRSQGCPAVRPEVAQQVVDSLKDGQFMFSYYPDQRWLASSPYLNCEPRRVAQIIAPLRGS